ncbi:murein biosynthesis integral membrane protein MurJ [Dyella sp. A6]|uniref:murein biosynthesis integral membrane protein MurJ n=1 Tax=Dyella aluminiiresistens TaxID=3069105 RepID=UPI002E7709CC|nr:murein biosynthesis integral membrane protein MurJ [Dyella sp. A6]
MLRGLLSFSSMTMVSRVLGLARDIAMSHVFGASAATDAFVIAFRIPNFMRRLFAEGSFSTAFVPVFTEVKETRSHAELKELTARVAGTLGGVLLVVTALGMLFAPELAAVFAPGDVHDPHKFGLIVSLLRLTFPYLLFVSLTALAGGALNSFHRFGLPAMAPVILNICMITGALWLAPRLQVPIMALGWAVLVAGVLQLLFLLPALRGLNLLSLPRWGWRHPLVRRIMRLMVPTLFGASVGQLNLLLDTILITLLVTGSQTWMYQSTRFLELPLGVFGVALGAVILPALSRHHVGTDRAGFSKALDWGVRMTLLIAVPATCALLLLAEPLVSTFFQNGHYTAFDTRMTSWSTMALCCGVPAYALVKVLLPAFYARQDTRTPVRAAVVSLVSNMVFNVLLVGLLYELWTTPVQRQDGWLHGLAHVPGLHVGLAIASVLSNYLQFAQLWYWLKRAGVYDPQPGWLRHWSRLGFACAAMVAVLLVGRWCWPHWTTVPVWTRVWHLAVLVLTGGATYVAGLFVSGLRLRDLRAS